MKRLLANAKDRRWQIRNRERKFWYRVGGFRTCAHCESQAVFRAIDPKAAGFTYYCFDCSAKDGQCWPRKEGYSTPAAVRRSNNKLINEQQLRCGPVTPGPRVPIRVFSPDGQPVSLAAAIQSYRPEPEDPKEPEAVPPGAPEEWPSWSPAKKAWWVRSQAYWNERASRERVDRDREASKARVIGLADKLRKGWAR